VPWCFPCCSPARPARPAIWWYSDGVYTCCGRPSHISRNITRLAGRLIPAANVDVAHSTDTAPAGSTQHTAAQTARCQHATTRLAGRLMPAASVGVAHSTDTAPACRTQHAAAQKQCMHSIAAACNRLCTRTGSCMAPGCAHTQTFQHPPNKVKQSVCLGLEASFTCAVRFLHKQPHLMAQNSMTQNKTNSVIQGLSHPSPMLYASSTSNKPCATLQQHAT
jgi:hypothetical protein